VKEIVSFHESGHAIVAESVEHADPVHKISIIPRGIAALGYTQQRPTEDRDLMPRTELLDRIAVLLGGRVAEELVFEEIFTGAQNGLQRATDIVRVMVTEYGMSDCMGLVTYERTHQPMLLQGNFSQSNTYSEEKAAQIDGEIALFIDETHQRVKKSSRSGGRSGMRWPISFRRRKAFRETNSERCCPNPRAKWRPHRPRRNNGWYRRYPIKIWFTTIP